MHYIAIYDLDKTITRAATWTPFLVHAARAHAPWRLALLPIAAAGVLGYAAGLVGRGGLKCWAQRVMLGPRIDAQALDALARELAKP